MKFRIILLTMVSLCVPATTFAQEAYFYTQAWFDLPYSGTPEVTITCDSGVPLMQTDVVPVTFRVDFLMNGTVCEIVQNEIEGFTTSYAANTVR